MELKGLHHLTAVTGNAAGNVDFYTQQLGLRLVKKTVNQDDVSAYHLFYGDEVGNPGTEVTFFDWPRAGQYRPGPGAVSRTGLRVPSEDALGWWADHLSSNGVQHSGITEFAGHKRITFTDPEGQHLALIDDNGAPGGTPWGKSPVPADVGIRGLHSVELTVHQLDSTAHVLTDILGYKAVEVTGEPGERQAIYALGDGGGGKEIYVQENGRSRLLAAIGIGGVHHVAFRVADAEAQIEWRNKIMQAGLDVSPVIDRFYFKSIYFRIPSHILFEIATDGPGFATDEDAEHLGERLALPPFLEPHRNQIEAGLQPIG
jgi:glyoxalase family protein